MFRKETFKSLLDKTALLSFNYSFHRQLNNHKKYYKYYEGDFNRTIEYLNKSIEIVKKQSQNDPIIKTLKKALNELIDITKENI